MRGYPAPQPVTLALILAQVLDSLVLRYWCGNQEVEEVVTREEQVMGTESQLVVRLERSDDLKGRKGNPTRNGGRKGQKKQHCGLTRLPQGRVLVHPRKEGTTMERNTELEIRNNHRHVE